MGNCGELCAKEYKFSREAQDEFAKESFRRALAAQKEGSFNAEIAPVERPAEEGRRVVVKRRRGAGQGRARRSSASLKPAFEKDGTITAANASSINDGARALVLASERAVKEHGLEPLARIVGYGSAAQAPEWFTTAPAKAIDRTLDEARARRPSDIDLFEINEAFAVVAMAVQRSSRARPAQGQRARRRGRARPPHRRERRAHPHHAAPRDEGRRTRSAASRRSASAAAKRWRWSSSADIHGPARSFARASLRGDALSAR